MRTVLSARVECCFSWRQSEDEPTMARIHRLEPKNVPEEGAVRFCIFTVDNDVSARNHTHLFHNASPTKRGTGLKTGHYKLRDALKRAPTTSY